MRQNSLNSLLLASTDPARLHAWYVAALEPSGDTKVDSYRVLSFDGFTLLIDTRSDIGATNPEPGRVILNFEVADARTVVARLEGMGAAWKAELEDRDGNLFATAVDPDGNYVQIIQLSQESRRAMAAPSDPAWLGGAPFSGFAVADVAAAKRFYGETLGLDVTEENGLLTLHLAGGREVLVYPKPDHAPASYTILNFPVADIDQAVDHLGERGVRFERYEGFDQDAKGIQRADGPPIAWFTDPSGNILAVLETDGG
jgi:catechol 2,3-dioxygenase-like lactoylglutathione lyase family enzyme